MIQTTDSLRVNINDFMLKNLIGKGFYGKVYLTVEKETKHVYAIKMIRKSSTMTLSEIKVERDIMAHNTSEWITSLQYAFQV